MTEQDRGQIVEGADRTEDDERSTSRRGCRITGFSDLLPDWILPPEGKEHMRNARKEALLAMRSILDAAIERQEAGPSSSRRPQRIEID
jgi:hypothetical protein